VVVDSTTDVSEVRTASLFRIGMSKAVKVRAYINFDPTDLWGSLGANTPVRGPTGQRGG
jgi:hypothetical protein